MQLRVFNPVTGMDILRVTPTSRASSAQRAGRAGRTSSGKCLRLYPESAFAALPASTPPEICRSDVSLFILQLKALGIDNIVRFDFMTPPPAKMLERGMEFLYSLGAIDANGRLTQDLGVKMAEVILCISYYLHHGADVSFSCPSTLPWPRLYIYLAYLDHRGRLMLIFSSSGQLSSDAATRS